MRLPRTPRIISALTLGTLAVLGLTTSRSRAADAEKPRPQRPYTVFPAAPTNQVQTGNPEADKAWQEIIASGHPPAQPTEWAQKTPTPAQRAEYRGKVAAAALEAADRAKGFRTRFPQDPRLAEARKAEARLLQTASRMGNTNVADRILAVEGEQLADPSLPEADRVGLLAEQVQRKAQARAAEGNAATAAELAKGASELRKQFPKNPLPYRMLVAAAASLEPDRARSVAEELLHDTNSPPRVKESAQELLRRLEAASKPLTLKFTAVDGREVDLASLRGKVVLLDFWATWSVAYTSQLPLLKAGYEKLHPKGLEIVGISLDQSKESLTNFLAKAQIPWPQYFDGKGWQNDLRRQFGIGRVPTMWLIDKKGLVREAIPDSRFEKQAEQLLAEPP